MSVRKRVWTTPKGEEKSAWVVDYFDQNGKRRLKTFRLKKEADAFALTSGVEVRDGLHVPDSNSATIREAGKLWLAAKRRAGLEQSSVDQYRQHLELHLVPLIGETKLTALTVPALRAFEERLRDEGRSPAMVKKLVATLGSLLADAQERGLVIRNVVRDVRGQRKGSERRQEKRARGKLKVGVDIPTPAEIKAIVGALAGRWRPLLLTAVFTGLRASELRGLTWDALDFDKRTLRVYQRADRFNQIGPPKSEAGERVVPLPPIVVNTLKEWKLACAKGDLRLVFPTGAGGVESLGNIINRGLGPSQVAAGVSVESGKLDQNGQPIFKAKYPGIHALRHFYASWCINRARDGGLGLPPKVVQERLGHSSITMTMDVYGHLFPRGDDHDEMVQAERLLLG